MGFEEYADDQNAWMRDYVPAMEKMLANGYETGLVDVPDFTTGVVCPFPAGDRWQIVMSCYKSEVAGSGPAYVIRSDFWGYFWTSEGHTGTVVQAGAEKEEMWSFTGSDKQLWKWSESGNQLINLATGKPLAVGGFTEWRVTNSSQWPYSPMLETQHGNKALDAWAAKDNGCGGVLIVGNSHVGGGQWFSLHQVDEFVADPSKDCPPTTPAPTTTAASATTAPITAPTTVECTEDGDNVLADEFLIESVFDSSVIADDGSGTLVLQKRDTSSLSASSLQTWQVAPLCNGKVKVFNVGTGNTMSFGPWFYDSETKLLKSDTGRWAMNKKRKGLRLEAKVKYLKNTTTPWKRFQWNIVKV